MHPTGKKEKKNQETNVPLKNLKRHQGKTKTPFKKPPCTDV